MEFLLVNVLKFTGARTGCGGAELHPMVKSASAASWEHFCLVLKIITKIWTIKVLSQSEGEGGGGSGNKTKTNYINYIEAIQLNFFMVK